MVTVGGKANAAAATSGLNNDPSQVDIPVIKASTLIFHPYRRECVAMGLACGAEQVRHAGAPTGRRRCQVRDGESDIETRKRDAAPQTDPSDA